MAKPGKLTESSIQSAVWQIELGRGKIVVVWVLLVLLALALALLYTAAEFRGLEQREAMDQAQVARNLARGEGYTTYLIRPLSLWQLRTTGPGHDPRVLQHPDLINPPVYPAALAGLFRLLPPTIFQAKVADRFYAPERLVIVPFNQFCLLLTLVLVFCWARQLFEQRVAITAALLLLFADVLWAYSISGLCINLLTLLLLLAVYCLYQADRRLSAVAEDGTPIASPPWQAPALVVAGAVLLGLAFLTRYLVWVVVPPLACYVAAMWRGRRPGLWTAVFVVVFLAAIAPWLLRNQQVAGTWFGIAGYAMIENVGAFAGDNLYRSADPTQNNALAVAWSVKPVLAKVIAGLRTQFYENLPQTGLGVLMVFFGAGLLYSFRRPEVRRLRNVLVAMLVAGLLGMAVVVGRDPTRAPQVSGDDLLTVLYPALAVFGVAFFYLLLDRVPFRIRLTRGLAIGAFALLNAAPLILTLLPPQRSAFPYPPYLPPYTRLVASMFDRNELGCSDLPWAMAWDGDRRTVWLPTTPAAFNELHDLGTPHGFQFLMLTPYMLDRPLQNSLRRGEYGEWWEFVGSKPPKLFPLKAYTPLPPRSEQRLYADRERWKEGDLTEPEPPAAPGKTPLSSGAVGPTSGR